jgi:hypothetical protein
VRFTDATESMNGHVFECYDEQVDRRQYEKTIEALEGYIKGHGQLVCKAELTASAHDRTLGIALLRGADPARFGNFITDLSNQCALWATILIPAT